MPSQNKLRKIKLSIEHRKNALDLLAQGLKIHQTVQQLRDLHHAAYTLDEVNAAYFPKSSSLFISDMEGKTPVEIAARYEKISKSIEAKSNALKKRWQDAQEREQLEQASFKGQMANEQKRSQVIAASKKAIPDSSTARSEAAKKRWTNATNEKRTSDLTSSGFTSSEKQTQRAQTRWVAQSQSTSKELDENKQKTRYNFLRKTSRFLRRKNITFKDTNAFYLNETRGRSPGRMLKIPVDSKFELNSRNNRLKKENSARVRLFIYDGKLFVKPTDGHIVIESSESVDKIHAGELRSDQALLLEHADVLTVGLGEHSSKFRVVNPRKLRR